MPTKERKTQIMGSSFHRGAGQIISKLRGGEVMWLRREPTNKHDPNAIAVGMFGLILGYLPRGVAAEFAPRMDAGLKLAVTKLGSGTFGATVKLIWDEPPEVLAPPANEHPNMPMPE